MKQKTPTRESAGEQKKSWSGTLKRHQDETRRMSHTCQHVEREREAANDGGSENKPPPSPVFFFTPSFVHTRLYVHCKSPTGADSGDRGRGGSEKGNFIPCPNNDKAEPSPPFIGPLLTHPPPPPPLRPRSSGLSRGKAAEAISRPPTPPAAAAVLSASTFLRFGDRQQVTEVCLNVNVCESQREEIRNVESSTLSWWWWWGG